MRAKIDERTRIVQRCIFEFPEGQIRSIASGHPVATSPDSGAIAAYHVGDDDVALSQRFEGRHLVHTFTTSDGGSRRNHFTLSNDGRLLTMRATVTSPRLSVSVSYTLTYERMEGP